MQARASQVSLCRGHLGRTAEEGASWESERPSAGAALAGQLGLRQMWGREGFWEYSAQEVP